MCPEAQEGKGSLRAVLYTEPPESVPELGLHRGRRDVHAMRDLVVSEALGHQFERLCLARCQVVVEVISLR